MIPSCFRASSGAGLIVTLLLSGLSALSAGGSETFEVASIKPSGQLSRAQLRLLEMEASEGVPGFLPGRGQRVEIRGMSVSELVAAAYRVPLREVSGPSWISDIRFDVEALIPSGKGRDKAPEMLRTLLEERLSLKAHRSTRKTSGYTLTVAKGGPKLTGASASPAADDANALMNRPRQRVAGFREQLDRCDMAKLAAVLSQDLQAPVEDRTDLKGQYTITLQIPAGEMKDEFERPARFAEALSVYGLRLVGHDIEAPVLIIDSLSKTPTGN